MCPEYHHLPLISASRTQIRPESVKISAYCLLPSTSVTPSPLFGRVLSHGHNTTHVGRDTSFCLATTVPSLSLPSLSLERNSFISEAPQLLPSNSSPCHIPALKNTFKFCTAIATTMLPAMHRANAIGMGLSRSHKQNSLSGTLQPVLLHS